MIFTAKITGDGLDALSVSLLDILMAIEDPEQFTWSILWLTAVGAIDSESILDFESRINQSKNGLIISWELLSAFGKQVEQVIDITLIASKNRDYLHRYENDEDMYSACHYTFELMDSSYWIIHSHNSKFIEKMNDSF